MSHNTQWRYVLLCDAIHSNMPFKYCSYVWKKLFSFNPKKKYINPIFFSSLAVSLSIENVSICYFHWKKGFPISLNLCHFNTRLMWVCTKWINDSIKKNVMRKSNDVFYVERKPTNSQFAMHLILNFIAMKKIFARDRMDVRICEMGFSSGLRPRDGEKWRKKDHRTLKWKIIHMDNKCKIINEWK